MLRQIILNDFAVSRWSAFGACARELEVRSPSSGKQTLAPREPGYDDATFYMSHSRDYLVYFKREYNAWRHHHEYRSTDFPMRGSKVVWAMQVCRAARLEFG